MPVDPAAKLRELFATFLQLDTTQLFLHDELTQVCFFREVPTIRLNQSSALPAQPCFCCSLLAHDDCLANR